jgi:hypothetical protein
MTTGNSNNAEEFHLGLTMAGAISAGCYTAGAIDYLFEMLHLWEQAKNGEDIGLSEHLKELIPQHKVIIDVMGGASAGGMTTSMAALYALQGKINPIKTPPSDRKKTNNVLFDSWVQLDDSKDETTFEKLWKTSDIDNGKKIRSILNSQSIDNIAERAFDVSGDMTALLEKLPSYISKDLDIILSICMLRGMPIEVGFKTPIRSNDFSRETPKHATYEHFTVAHFKYAKSIENVGPYLWYNPFLKPYKDALQLSTIATGAFPVGLKYRKFEKTVFSNKYLKATAERIIFRNFGKGIASNTRLREEILMVLDHAGLESISKEKFSILLESIQTNKSKLKSLVQNTPGLSLESGTKLLSLIQEVYVDNEGIKKGIENYINSLDIPFGAKTNIKKVMEDLPSGKGQFMSELLHYLDAKSQPVQEILIRLNEFDYYIDWSSLEKDFSFLAIDGGTINNEPYGEVLSTLINKFGDSKGEKYKTYGIVMIDPFPDRSDLQDEYQEPNDLFQVIPKIIGTLKDQSRVKRKEAVDLLNGDHLRGVIYPSKWETLKNGELKKSEWPIASETLGGFGGFLSYDFREHDFFLGRNNARTFFRYFFSFPYDEVADDMHPIHRSWTKEMRDFFKFEDEKESGRFYLPIIPDMNLLLENKSKETKFNDYTIKQKPALEADKILELHDAIENRLSKLLENAMSGDFEPMQKKKKTPISDALIEGYYRKNILSRAFSPLGNLFVNYLVMPKAKGKISEGISKRIVQYVLNDLESKEYLKK